MAVCIWICCLHTFLDNKHMTRFGVLKTKKSTLHTANPLSKNVICWTWRFCVCALGPYLCCLYHVFHYIFPSHHCQLHMICVTNSSLGQAFMLHSLYIFITISKKRRKIHGNWPVKALFLPYATSFLHLLHTS